jgi:hypothetical protein
MRSVACAHLLSDARWARRIRHGRSFRR